MLNARTHIEDDLKDNYKYCMSYSLTCPTVSIRVICLIFSSFIICLILLISLFDIKSYHLFPSLRDEHIPPWILLSESKTKNNQISIMITNLLEYSISDNDTIQLQPLTNYSADVISVNPFKYDKKCIASIIHNPRNIRNTFYYSSNITQYLTDENLMALKSFNLQDCKEFQGIFTRENVDRFIRSSKCLWVKSAIRSHSLLLNYWRGIHTIKNITTDLEAYKKAHNYSEWFNYYPIYYMVPKCGSSSVFNMMKYLNMFRKQGLQTFSAVNIFAIFYIFL